VISMQTRNTRINEPDAFPAYINALALGITRHIVLYSVSVCCAIQMVLHPVKTMTVNTMTTWGKETLLNELCSFSIQFFPKIPNIC